MVPLSCESSRTPVWLPGPAAGSEAEHRRPEGGLELIFVGGVPGAGKSMAIASATRDLIHVDALDPEHVAGWLRRQLPARVPYRAYRWLVHLVHTARVVRQLAAGPRPGRCLVIHDPGTSLHRRAAFHALARRMAWRPVLMYVDVDRRTAQAGQISRGRVVRSFDAHWQSWQLHRPNLLAAANEATGRGPVAGPVLFVDRGNAAAVLRRLCLSA